MIGLIKKDFYIYLGSGQLKYIALFIILYGIIGITSNNMSFLSAAMVAFVAVFPINSISLDQNCHWDAFAVTMPVKRKDIIIGKYIISTILILIGGTLSIICSFFMKSSFSENLFVTIVILSLSLIWTALSYPIIFKMGIEKGKLISMGIIVIPVVIGVAAGKEITNFLVQFINFNKFETFFENYGYLILLVVSILIYVISSLISIKIFERKDL